MTVLLWKLKEGHLWQGWKEGLPDKGNHKKKIYIEKMEGKAKSLVTFSQIPFLCSNVILTNESEHVFAQKS